MSSHDRLPPIPDRRLTSAQREAAQAVIDGPRGALVGPFVPLLRSPELMEHAQRMGEYLRFRSAIGTRLSELVILLVAREWDQQVEWAIHAPIALEAGVPQEVIDAVARWERPARLQDDEVAVYDFSLELVVNKKVQDDTWNRALALFGEQGVMDLMALNGYYTLLAMVMNGAQTPAPESSAAPLP
ncbi:carboxymuconolactone decarboxylase family protein [Massilia arenosa]|uniref:Carboxymuconolactone decarboxylase family protein n=1 Tax=Zemynaea arenosa TaxID=2561931 RepID=A0A4Y9RNS9_9BURK|nr:carboxymuconolactone decarboxylase family protein [Massilia arenosa]TFW10710.1 carboxymuconolactone decarboxylase family protein [Massilia arenosa]